MYIFSELFIFKYDRINLDNYNNWENPSGKEKKKDIYEKLITS
jgi:hypothetical protein